MNKKRTAGDGMESDENTSEADRQVGHVSGKSNLRKTSKELLPGRLIQVFPTNVIKPDKKSHQINSKSPKFVPYEPYPGAVKTMTPQSVSKGTKKSKNNMDINTLISQMSQMNTNLNEFKPRPKLHSSSEKSTIDEKTNPEREEIQKKMDALLHENEMLKEQLNQQVQVK